MRGENHDSQGAKLLAWFSLEQRNPRGFVNVVFELAGHLQHVAIRPLE